MDLKRNETSFDDRTQSDDRTVLFHFKRPLCSWKTSIKDNRMETPPSEDTAFVSCRRGEPFGHWRTPVTHRRPCGNLPAVAGSLVCAWKEPRSPSRQHNVFLLLQRLKEASEEDPTSAAGNAAPEGLRPFSFNCHSFCLLWLWSIFFIELNVIF